MNFDWFLNQFRTKFIKQSCNKFNKFDSRCKNWNCWSRCKMSVNLLNMFYFESSSMTIELKKSKYAKKTNFAISTIFNFVCFRIFRFRCFDVIARAKEKKRFSKKLNTFSNWFFDVKDESNIECREKILKKWYEFSEWKWYWFHRKNRKLKSIC